MQEPSPPTNRRSKPKCNCHGASSERWPVWGSKETCKGNVSGQWQGSLIISHYIYIHIIAAGDLYHSYVGEFIIGYCIWRYIPIKPEISISSFCVVFRVFPDNFLYFLIEMIFPCYSMLFPPWIGYTPIFGWFHYQRVSYTTTMQCSHWTSNISPYFHPNIYHYMPTQMDISKF